MTIAPDFAPLAGRAKAAVWSFAAIMVFNLVSVASEAAEYRLLGRVMAGDQVSDAALSASDTRVLVVSFVQFALYVAAAVLFIRWFHRAYQNVAGRRYGTGWAIGGWFVPFLAAWRPKQIANDIWRESTPQGGEARLPALFAVWWGGWLVSSFLGNIVGRLALRSETLEELRTADIVYLVSDGFDIIAAVPAILVVRRLTARLEQRAAEAGAEAVPAT